MSELKTNLEQILQEKTTKLIPENIKRKVEIFDVTGTDGDAEVEELQAKIIETRQEIADTRRDLENSAATVTGTGENVTLNQTAEATFKKLGVGGNSEQESTNNLLYLDDVRGGYNDIEPTLEDGIVNLKGINNADYPNKGSYQNGYVEIFTTQPWKPSTTYYISCKIEIISNQKNLSTSYFSTFLYGVQNFSINYNSDTGRYEGYVATPSTLPEYAILDNRRYVEIRIDGMELNISEMSLKDTEDYTFDGYGIKPSPEYESPITNVTGDVEVKVQNKNLFKIKNYSKTGWNITIDNPLKGLLPGNYTLSTVNKYITANKGMTIYFSDIVNGSMNDKIGEVFVSYEFGNTQMSNTKSITQEQINAKYLIIGPQDILCTQEVLENMQISIEKGSTSTPYTPHKEQVFTFPLGNEKLMLGDYLADDGIHHVRGQVVLDGTERWFRNDLTTGQRFALNVTDFNFKKINSLGDDLLSNYFKGISYNVYYSIGGINGVSYNYYNNINYLQIFLKENYTLNEFKTWLQTKYNNNTPVIVEYELNEETITPYTSEQQRAYDAMKKAISYEEQTNVSSLDTVSPIFTVIAFKDADLAIASLDNRVTLLED